jgi:predicted TPR repeat methyltransferase
MAHEQNAVLMKEFEAQWTVITNTARETQTRRLAAGDTQEQAQMKVDVATFLILPATKEAVLTLAASGMKIEEEQPSVDRFVESMFESNAEVFKTVDQYSKEAKETLKRMNVIMAEMKRIRQRLPLGFS